MCGRYALKRKTDELTEHFALAECEQTSIRYNIAPSQLSAVVRLKDNTRHLDLLRWGLLPKWSKTSTGFINARAETAEAKPAFRSAFKKRRCLIPADGFYEWRKHDGPKEPFFICRKDGGLFAMAGLFEPAVNPGEPDTFTILTTEPNEVVSSLHDRMPVILSPQDYETWLTAPPDALAKVQELLRPFPAEEIRAYPVSKHVNSPTHDDATCIAPIA